MPIDSHNILANIKYLMQINNVNSCINIENTNPETIARDMTKIAERLNEMLTDKLGWNPFIADLMEEVLFIAMMLAIAATRSDGPVLLSGAESVNKSYPGFWEDYKALGGQISICQEGDAQ